MISYIMLGTNDLAKSKAFYAPLVTAMGGQEAYQTEDMVAWKFDQSQTLFAVTLPYNKEQATVGNGVMVALNVESTEQVDQLHAQALALGGSNEGSPGYRGKHFYAGYFRDRDGNKLNVFYQPSNATV